MLHLPPELILETLLVKAEFRETKGQSEHTIREENRGNIICLSVVELPDDLSLKQMRQATFCREAISQVNQALE